VTLIRIAREGIEDVVAANPLLLQEFGRAIDERRARVLGALTNDSAETNAGG
jgi:hypothetical protein